MSSESLSSEQGEEDQPTTALISNMEARSDHQMQKRFHLLFGVTSGVGITLIVLVLVWLLLYQHGFGWTDPALQFNWHPMLMTFGLIFLYAKAILVYRGARQYRKKALKLWHAGLHLSAFVLAVIALKAVFDFHNYSKPPKPNLYTLHSWLGLTTVILFSYQFVAGFTTFLWPGLSRSLRSTILPIHVNFGVAIFVMAVVTAMLGLSEKAIFSLGSKYGERGPEGILINFIGLLLISFGILVVYLVNDATYKRTALPEDEIGLTGQTE